MSANVAKSAATKPQAPKAVAAASSASSASSASAVPAAWRMAYFAGSLLVLLAAVIAAASEPTLEGDGGMPQNLMHNTDASSCDGRNAEVRQQDDAQDGAIFRAGSRDVGFTGNGQCRLVCDGRRVPGRRPSHSSVSSSDSAIPRMLARSGTRLQADRDQLHRMSEQIKDYVDSAKGYTQSRAPMRVTRSMARLEWRGPQ